MSKGIGIGQTIPPIWGRLYETGHSQRSSESFDPRMPPRATGYCRFGRPLDASALALGSQNGPECRANLGWNERNFLSRQ